MILKPVDFKGPDVSKEFTRSLKESGFCVLRNHPINQKLITEVFKEWEEFFQSNYKMNYFYNKDTLDGFIPANIAEKAAGYDVKDIKEFYNYFIWGQYPTELSEKTRELREQMSAVASTLLNWIEDDLPDEVQKQLSEPLAQMIENSAETLMRMIHYPALTGNEEDGAIRASAHKDTSLLTILVAASQSGLQVEGGTDKNGNDIWVDIPVDPGMLAINVGRMLSAISNDLYASTLHRVINPSDEKKHFSRYSIPLFLQPRSDVKLKDGLTAGEMLGKRNKELGLY